MPIEPVNASKTSWRLNFDLRIDKTIRLGRGFNMMFYLRILNLLNTKQIENVYPYSHSAETDGMIYDRMRSESHIQHYGEEARDMYNALNTTNSQSYWDYTANELYLNPRQIFLGLRLEY